MSLYTGTQFPEKYRNGAFIAFHGSWNRAPRSQQGYKIVFVPFDEKGMPTGKWENFAEGFPGVDEFVSPSDARYRPAGVAMGPDGSLFITDTRRGRIWRVIYTGEKTPPTTRLATTAAPPRAPQPKAGATAVVAVDEKSKGAQVYSTLCAACHMPNGGGAPPVNPGLLNSAVVKGDVDTLIRVILEGPAAVLPADREKFQVMMPPMDAVLDDESVAGVVSYIRARFANDGTVVTPAKVKALRKGK
jgi:mono/diheme cytochrome c family protein